MSDGIGDNIHLFNPLIRMLKKLPRVLNFVVVNRRQEKPVKVDVVFGFECVSYDFRVLRIKYRKYIKST